MKTKDFISKYRKVTDLKKRRCSSVVYNGKDTFYSYGQHYPLLVKFYNKWFLNDADYSVSTQRHINWARPFADGVWNYNYGALPTAITAEIKEIKSKLSTLSRRAFRQKEGFTNRLEALKSSLNTIKK